RRQRGPQAGRTARRLGLRRQRGEGHVLADGRADRPDLVTPHAAHHAQAPLCLETSTASISMNSVLYRRHPPWRMKRRRRRGAQGTGTGVGNGWASAPRRPAAATLGLGALLGSRLGPLAVRRLPETPSESPSPWAAWAWPSPYGADPAALVGRP